MAGAPGFGPGSKSDASYARTMPSTTCLLASPFSGAVPHTIPLFCPLADKRQHAAGHPAHIVRGRCQRPRSQLGPVREQPDVTGGVEGEGAQFGIFTPGEEHGAVFGADPIDRCAVQVMRFPSGLRLEIQVPDRRGALIDRRIRIGIESEEGRGRLQLREIADRLAHIVPIQHVEHAVLTGTEQEDRYQAVVPDRSCPRPDLHNYSRP